MEAAGNTLAVLRAHSFLYIMFSSASGFENSKIKIKDFFFRTSSVFPFFQIVDLELKVRIHWRIWSK